MRIVRSALILAGDGVARATGTRRATIALKCIWRAILNQDNNQMHQDFSVTRRD